MKYKKILSAEKAIKITENSESAFNQILSTIASRIEKAANDGRCEIIQEIPGEEYVWYKKIIKEIEEGGYNVDIDEVITLGVRTVRLEISWKHLRFESYNTMRKY